MSLGHGGAGKEGLNVTGVRPRLKFGLALDYLDGQLSLRENFEILAELVRAARIAGFDLIYHAQHFLKSESPRFQPLPVLSRLASESGEMLLVCAEILPLNHPVRVAECLATLDVLTDGRAILLGVLGYQRSEFQAFGIDIRERSPRLRISYELIGRLLSGETVTAQTEHFTLDHVELGGMLRTVSQPRPAIWVTAHNDAGVRRAALSGDAWFMSHQPTLGELRRQMSLFRECRSRRVPEPFHHFASHGIHFPILREAFVAPTTGEAIRVSAEPMMATVGEYLRSDQMNDLNDPASYREPFHKWRVDRALVGDPHEVSDDLERYVQLGVDCVVLKMHRRGIPFEKVLEAIHLTGEHVIPKFAGKGATSERVLGQVKSANDS